MRGPPLGFDLLHLRWLHSRWMLISYDPAWQRRFYYMADQDCMFALVGPPAGAVMPTLDFWRGAKEEMVHVGGTFSCFAV